MKLSIYFPHYPLSHESHDSGFKVVGQPVLAQPKLGDDNNDFKNRRFVNNNNLAVIDEPRLGGDGHGNNANRVIPQADRDRQVVAPNVGVQPQVTLCGPS